MWKNERTDWPDVGVPVIGIFPERLGREVHYVMRVDGDDRWYEANPNGSPINCCPDPEWWSHPPKPKQE